MSRKRLVVGEEEGEKKKEKRLKRENLMMLIFKAKTENPTLIKI